MTTTYLTIDQGNSAAKIALWADTELLKLHIAERLTPDVMASFLRGCRRARFLWKHPVFMP